jgi:hypothetical protein
MTAVLGEIKVNLVSDTQMDVKEIKISFFRLAEEVATHHVVVAKREGGGDEIYDATSSWVYSSSNALMTFSSISQLKSRQTPAIPLLAI